MIPFLDLKPQYRIIKPEIDDAIARVLESAQFILGDEVAAFEKEFAAYSGAQHGIAVNSATSALHLALLAAGVGPGAEVVTTAFTFVATVAAIGYTGARAVLADIEPRSFTVDPAKLEAAITARTKAIIPVHLYGQPADMDSLLEIARRRKLIVIEDAAQAHGAEYKGRRAGSMGDFGCFSFYPGKNLGAYGEGGLVTVSKVEHARTVRLLRNWGEEKRYQLLAGYNYRMEGMQGAILRVKLRHLEQWTEARRAHAAQYDKLLAGSGVQTPAQMPYARHVYHVYAVRVRERAESQQKLTEAGVQTGIHYPTPVHLQPAYASLGYKRGDFPHAEAAAAEVLSLPMFPEMTSEQVEQVVAAVRAAARQRAHVGQGNPRRARGARAKARHERPEGGVGAGAVAAPEIQLHRTRGAVQRLRDRRRRKRSGGATRALARLGEASRRRPAGQQRCRLQAPRPLHDRQRRLHRRADLPAGTL
jgi:dTDP-4-amino-4,6-dideoxygalactose transaminase